MKNIDRYILSELIRPFFGTSAFFTFIFLMFQGLRLSELLVVHHVSVPIVAKMCFYIMLTFSAFIIPVACLASILIGFGRLSAENEIIAFKSAGVSMWRISVPVLAFALIASSFSFALNMWWSPWGDRSLSETIMRLGGTKAISFLKEKTFNHDFFDLLIYAEKIDQDTDEMEKVFVYDSREKNDAPSVIVANQGRIVPIENKALFGKEILLQLDYGKLYRLNAAEAVSQVIDFKKYSLHLKVDEGGSGDLAKPRMTSMSQLLEVIHAPPKDIGHYRDMATEFWKRVSVSLSPIFLSFLGMGLGVVRIRSGAQSRGIILTLICMVIYWQVLAISNEKAVLGIINIPFGLEIPNLLIAVMAAIAIRRTSF